MKSESTIQPPGQFEIEALKKSPGAPCVIIFYQSVEETQHENEDGTSTTIYRYDTYRLDAVWAAGLQSRVAANYDAWLAAAIKAETAQEGEKTESEKIAELQDQVESLRADNDILSAALETLVLDALA